MYHKRHLSETTLIWVFIAIGFNCDYDWCEFESRNRQTFFFVRFSPFWGLFYTSQHFRSEAITKRVQDLIRHNDIMPMIIITRFKIVVNGTSLRSQKGDDVRTDIHQDIYYISRHRQNPIADSMSSFNFVISRIHLAIMEETVRCRFSFRASYFWTGLRALLNLLMIVLAFMQLEGKFVKFAYAGFIYTCTYIISDETDCSSGQVFYFGIAFFTTHLWIDLVFFLGLWKEISPALAICSLIFLLDFCFYVYVSVISDPVDDAVSAIIVIFAILYFFGFTNGLTNILYILWCRNRADQNKVYITFSQMTKSSLKDDIV